MFLVKKYFFAACCAVALYGATGCSQVEPFVDARREAGSVKPVGSSTKNNPAVCYGLFGSQEDIDALAANECALTGRKAEFLRKENFACKIFTPQKAVYKCVETAEPVPEYQSVCTQK